MSPGEVLHIALANRTPALTSVGNFFVVASDPRELPPDKDDDGCTCSLWAPANPAARWILAGLPVLAFGRRRRRVGRADRSRRAKAVFNADGVIDPKERESFELLEQLLV